jgi:hypothetical protein
MGVGGTIAPNEANFDAGGAERGLMSLPLLPSKEKDWSDPRERGTPNQRASPPQPSYVYR